VVQDTLREDCDSSDNCERNCCVSRVVAPVFFVVFVLVAQFVLVNVVVAVLMKHLEVKYAYICIARLRANASNALRYGSHSVTCKQHHIYRLTPHICNIFDKR